MIFEGLTDKQIADMAREDFDAARRSRQEIEERKLEAYRLYRLWRKELKDGGKGTANGPFGWSRLSVPIVFWIVETILPRLGINTPTITVKARSPYAVRFQQAKQLRVNHYMRACHMDEQMLLTLKQFLVLGDGPVKTPWDADLGGPSFRAIDWFDWFVSPDAALWHEAEVMYHRTWHTRRSIAALVERDRNRRDGAGERLPPLYDHDALERIATGSATREADDATHTSRREASGLGPATFPDKDGPVALVECYYRDGSMCVIAGDETPVVVRVVREPMYRDPKGRPFRPFVVFQNTPDLFQPYGISDAEMVMDHQHESSTIKNQAIDQATGNINSLKAYNRQKIDAAEIQAAWSLPNGLLGVDGPPREAIDLFPPGQLTSDVERLLEHNRREAQETVGISDVVQGIAAAQMQTATEIASLREEANQRFRLKIKLVELPLRRVAEHFEWLDRYISTSPLSVPVDSRFELEQGARGITMLEGGGFARVDTQANAPGMEYDLELDAGTMVPPNKAEEAEKVRALVADIGGLMAAFPQLGMMVNAPELLRMMVEATGHDPDRILIDPMLLQQQQALGPAGPPAPGGGEEPVGDPIPVDEAAVGGPTPA